MRWRVWVRLSWRWLRISNPETDNLLSVTAGLPNRVGLYRKKIAVPLVGWLVLFQIMIDKLPDVWL